MNKTTLCAEPYLGEFGWELFCWQGYIRTLSTQYDRTIVYCKTGHDYLYKDFASEIINYDPPKEFINASSSKLHDFEVPTDLYKYQNYDKLIKARQIHDIVDNKPGCENIAPTYIKYGTDRTEPYKYDILIHARSTKKNLKQEEHRNWSEEYCETLVTRLKKNNLKFAFFGAINGSYASKDAPDFRGQTIEEDVKLITSSRMVLGPSSGPMHLASLCGCPHIVTFWNEDPGIFLNNTKRYRYIWNPLKTDVITIGDAWMPDINLILEAIKDLNNE